VLGWLNELAVHSRSSRNTGADARQIAEVLLHVAVAAGSRAAHAAFSLAKIELAPTPAGNQHRTADETRREER